MICKPCAQAADQLTAVKTAVPAHIHEFLRYSVEAAEAGHAECRGKTACDCQHDARAQMAGGVGTS